MKTNGFGKITSLVLGMLLYAGTMTGWAQTTWNIGYPTETDVIATLSLSDSTLTISGTGQMIQDHRGKSSDYFHAPWEPYINQIKIGIIEEGVTNIGRFTFMSCSNLTSVSIPSTVTLIDWMAFYECERLPSVTIPNGVQTIYIESFYGCNSLTSIHIPSSVTSIGAAAFSSCRNLTNITVDAANNNYLSEDGILFDKNKTTIMQYPMGKQGNSYVIPEGVTNIPSGAFTNCTQLTSITLPNSVTTISTGVYDKGAFGNCTGLASVIIPTNVTTIGNFAFASCTALTTITIPNSVEGLGYRAFGYCSGLRSIVDFRNTPQINIENPSGGSHPMFEGVNRETCVLYVPAGSAELYRNSVYDWQEFGTIIELTPHYTANSQSYPSTMTYTTAVVLNDVEWQSNLIEIGAFSSDECRGSVFVQQFSESTAHPYLGFLTVHGNSNEPITLRVYDHDTDKEYEATNAPVAFVADAIYGNSTEPYPIHLVSKQEIPLSEGWSWISVNMTNDEQPLIDQFKSNIGDAGVLLKGRNAFIQYPLWIGNLSEITSEDMYMVKTTTEQTLSFTGDWIHPASAPISLLKGWNWIGYPSLVALPVNEALANMNPQVGDQIKSQLSYSTYTDGQGWIGSLENMGPGNGYMYYSNNSTMQTLIYPSSSPQLAPARNVQGEAFAPHWTVDEHRYPNTMTATSVVLSDNVELQSNEIEIGAFSGDECRGSVLLKNFPQVADSYLGFLVIHGEGNEEIHLRIYDHAISQEYDATNVLSFEVNAIYGNPADPYRIVSSPTGITNIVNAVNVYLEQTGANLQIHCPWSSIDHLEITDLSGRVVLREANFTAASVNVASLTNSVYLLKLVKDGQVYVKKFIKK